MYLASSSLDYNPDLRATYLESQDGSRGLGKVLVLVSFQESLGYRF